MAIELVARQASLGFIMLADEEFDFIIPDDRLSRPSVRRFMELLQKPEVRAELAELGLAPRREALPPTV